MAKQVTIIKWGVFIEKDGDRTKRGLIKVCDSKSHAVALKNSFNRTVQEVGTKYVVRKCV